MRPSLRDHGNRVGRDNGSIMNRRLLVIGAVSFIVTTFLVGRILAGFDWNPTATVKFAEDAVEQTKYAEELLGEVIVAPDAGHDGKFFFSQAMDPFYLEPGTHAVFLDRPTYRAQRMLYPTLASFGGLLSPQGTAWGLIVVNVVAMVVGTLFTSLVARQLGISEWFGLVFVLNPGLIVALNIDGANIVAMAALMAGIYYVTTDRLLFASVAMTASVLARETMLIAALGLALYWYYKRRRVPWMMIIPPAAVVAWWGYVHWRLQGGVAQDTQAVGLPLVGFVHAFQNWIHSPDSTVDLAMGLLLLLVSMAILVRSVMSPTALGWGAAGFALLGLLLSEPVWLRWFDSTRALAPVLTAYALLVFASIESKDSGPPHGAYPDGGQPKRQLSRMRAASSQARGGHH
jgi:hypothetical protein